MLPRSESHRPVDARTREALQQVIALRAQADWRAADLALLAALDAAGQGAAANAAVGDLAVTLEAYGVAHDAYGRALMVRPDEPRYWFNRAAVRRFLGDLAGAETDYDACIARAPEDGQAWLNRSDLRVQTAGRNHVDGLECQLARPGQAWPTVVALRHALAKECEDLGHHAASWAHLVAGASLRRQHLQYRVDTDVATVDWLIEAFPREGTGPAARGHPSVEPVFILGMPRTGSTLVDRMVTAHSAVTPAGELLDFGNAVVDAARRQWQSHGVAGQAPDRRALVMASAGVDFAALGADYLQRTRPRSGQTARFTDKLPLNYLYCGLIDRALPGAKMVHVSRHPLATCYGVFKVLFAQGYPFSYDLGELAEYYIAYRRLIAHWQAVLGERLIEVRYEDLVAQPEQQCRRLLGQLGLDWEPDCLAFERNPKPTTTASASQVRRPIYTSALRVWQHHASALAPLQRRLEAAGIDCR